MRKKFQLFLKNNVFFHKCCKNTKIVSGYAYFTQKLFKMCLKGCCGLVCAFRWKKKTNFESFSVGQNLVIFQKIHTKTRIFATFFFLPHPFFGRKQTNCQKSHRPSQMTKILAKQFFITFWSELVAEIQNVRPPL